MRKARNIESDNKIARQDEGNRISASLLNDGCTGCGCCENICPVDAISMEYDEDGFLKPVLDEVRCIGCRNCIKSCPARTSGDVRQGFGEWDVPKCFAVRADDNIRMKSSSGGFFTVLSEYVFARGGYVYGAIWDEDFCCSIKEAGDAPSVAPMRYSKYVQSNTHKTFRQVRDRLKKGNIVAYFGCPCQIAGLKSYINNKDLSNEEIGRLITVDLVCFCAPSNLLFQKYLDEEFGIENVKNVNFRDKTSRGGGVL